MPRPFLLGRVLLRFGDDDDDLLRELSAVALDPDGNLWLGSDEYRSVERLTPSTTADFTGHKRFALEDLVELPKKNQEVDIEGLDWDGGYLWVCGSHSTKRKKPKASEEPQKNLDRIAKVKQEENRYLLARLPVLDGEPVACIEHASGPKLTAGSLKRTKRNNCLIEALAEDPHLGPFIDNALPSKENGLDIEGIAARGDRVWLGLRGPVLIGLACILELKVEESEPGVLTLKPIGENKRRYRKHLVNLDGLGIRDLVFQGDDLLVLAGPTMNLTGCQRVYRLEGTLDKQDDSLSDAASGDLTRLIDLPLDPDLDKAEGMTLSTWPGEESALLVVYDDPDPRRRRCAHAILADVFRLPGR